MAFTITQTYTAGETLTADKLERSFNMVGHYLNSAPLVSANLTDASVNVTELQNSFVEVPVNFSVAAAVWDGWTAGSTYPIMCVPLLDAINAGSSAPGVYTVTAAGYVINDWGTQGAQIKVDWGYLTRDVTGSPVWTTVQNVVPLTTLLDVNGTFGNDTGDTRLLFGAGTSIIANTTCGLGLFLVTDDTTAFTGGTNPFFTVSLMLKRQLVPAGS